MKHTKQKEAILNAVQTATNHPTADEIYQTLRRDNSKLSLGTVYRNLNQFAESGDIRKVVVPGAGDRFDFRLDSHEHFFCETCGRVIDADAVVTIDTSGCGDVVRSYTLMLRGTCAECVGISNTL